MTKSVSKTIFRVQESCKQVKEGFNARNDLSNAAARARIGLIGHDNCTSGAVATSRIGFGMAGSAGGMDPNNTCGNEATEDANGGAKSIKAFCYIFIK